MLVKKMELCHFRNYEHVISEFCDGVNIIIGDNAQGKTNLLESIFYCTSGHSFRSYYDKDLIGLNHNDAKITASILSENRQQTIEAKLLRGRGKTVFLNGVKCKSLSEISGKLTAVLFSPDDLSIIKEGASVRRKLMDTCICQMRPRYALALSQYARLYEGKTRILKDYHEKNSLLYMLDDYNEQMAKLSAELIYYRAHFMKRLAREAENIHREFSGEKENLSVFYQTIRTIQNPMEHPSVLYPQILERQQQLRQAELEAGQCLCGAHKDDLIIEINQTPARSFASQGQMRTAALSMKLAEREILFKDREEYPVLLLDDVLSELDPERQSFVLNKIHGGQVFITCCEEGQISKLTGGRILQIRGGKIL